MTTSIHNRLPLHSTTWVYQSSRLFTETEAVEIAQRAKQFAAQWTAHKVGVAGDGDLLYNLFVVLMADEDVTGVSGCSIDSSVHFIKSLEKDYGVSFFGQRKYSLPPPWPSQSVHLTRFQKKDRNRRAYRKHSGV
jgi:hypothetical protein